MSHQKVVAIPRGSFHYHRNGSLEKSLTFQFSNKSSSQSATFNSKFNFDVIYRRAKYKSHERVSVSHRCGVNETTAARFPFTHFRLSSTSERVPLNLSMRLVKPSLSLERKRDHTRFELDVYDGYVLENANYPGIQVRVELDYEYKYPQQ